MNNRDSQAFGIGIKNNGDVYVNMNNGFSGLLSSLRYYSYALTGIEVENLVKAGPNLTADDSLKIFPPYFSLRWFFSKPNDKYYRNDKSSVL